MIRLIVTFAFINLSYADCVTKLAKDTGYSVDRMSKIVMQCNNYLLDGQGVWLRSTVQTDATLRTRWPTAELGTLFRADGLITLTKCEKMARDLKLYIRRCERKINLNKERT